MAIPSPSPDEGPDELLCFSVYSTGLAFNRIYKPLLDAIGLTYPQCLVMVTLWASDDQTVGSLGAQLFLESNTLTPLLKRLEAMGYLTRRRDSQDERIVRLRLTPAGMALHERYAEIRSCVVASTGLAPADMEALHVTMRKLRAQLRRVAG